MRVGCEDKEDSYTWPSDAHLVFGVGVHPRVSQEDYRDRCAIKVGGVVKRGEAILRVDGRGRGVGGSGMRTSR